ncbi:hypothetical protein [Methanoplanus limicola]|uniref:Uncharacterized protein n=1 Tax=Methanoplanus limicola DSM 2279 TaxID=937775 RepID=H1Z3U0_9EURY|nr:hypothetical protein [Methanoplanus limicola]EHQ36562.1 hypothetical protein Metlim_2518 [Methanoplanus limicola DSM 2279]
MIRKHLFRREMQFSLQVKRKRLAESKREKIKRRAEEAVANYESGNVTSGSVDDLFE